MTKTNHFHTSHWGTFPAAVEDGRLTGVQPFPRTQTLHQLYTQ